MHGLYPPYICDRNPNTAECTRLKAEIKKKSTLLTDTKNKLADSTELSIMLQVMSTVGPGAGVWLYIYS